MVKKSTVKEKSGVFVAKYSLSHCITFRDIETNIESTQATLF